MPNHPPAPEMMHRASEASRNHLGCVSPGNHPAAVAGKIPLDWGPCFGGRWNIATIITRPKGIKGIDYQQKKHIFCIYFADCQSPGSNNLLRLMKGPPPKHPSLCTMGFPVFRQGPIYIYTHKCMATYICQKKISKNECSMPKILFTSKIKGDFCPRHGTSSTSSTSFSTAACPDSPLEGSS